MNTSESVTWLAAIAALAGGFAILSAVWFDASTVVLVANTIVGTVTAGFGILTAYASRQNEPVPWFLPAPAALSGAVLVAVALLASPQEWLLYTGVASGAVAAVTAGIAVAVVVAEDGSTGYGTTTDQDVG